MQHLDVKQRNTKEREHNPYASIVCPECGHICASELVLRSRFAEPDVVITDNDVLQCLFYLTITLFYITVF